MRQARMDAPSRGSRRVLPREQVLLNIYDLHDNSWLYHLGIGQLSGPVLCTTAF